MTRVRARRANAAGFTLVELMIVVLLISIVALLAVPRMSGARDDRYCFDFARQMSSILHRGHVRAEGRGAAHIAVYRQGTGNAGELLLFEALDGVVAGAGDAGATGPNPVSSCKDPTILTTVLNDMTAWTPGTYGNSARLVDAVTLNVPGIAVDNKIGSVALLNNAPLPAGNVTVVCFTPYGTAFYGTSGSLAAAVGAMFVAQPFTDAFEIDVQRGLNGGTPVGLTRRVILAGNSAPRIQSK